MYSNDDPSAIPNGESGGYVAPSNDPQLTAELEDLRAYRARSEQFLEQLTPHEARIKKLLEDGDAARVFDDSVSAYDRIREERKPKLPIEWDPEQNPLLKRMMKVADTVDSWDTRSKQLEQQQAVEANQRVVHEATTYAEQLIKDVPQLAENNFAGIKSIAAFATQSNLAFKDAAEQLMPVFRRQQTTPPKSLRPNQGAPGVPQRSEKPGDDDRSMFEIVRERLNKGRAV